MIVRARQLGFSLIEVLLSVAIIAIITGMSLPVYASFQNRNDLDISTQSIVSMLRRAQIYARGMNGDSAWGVRVQAGSASLFKGTSYATRDATYDETTSISPNTTVSGISEVVFSAFSAAPSAVGSITLTLNPDDVRTITINIKGMVNY